MSLYQTTVSFSEQLFTDKLTEVFVQTLLTSNPLVINALAGTETSIGIEFDLLLELTRYVMAVLVLERLLAKSSDSLSAVGRRIERLQQQLQHFQVTDDNIIASIADIYVEHISPLGNRIQIAGAPEQLKQSAVQQKIRALLLAVS